MKKANKAARIKSFFFEGSVRWVDWVLAAAFMCFLFLGYEMRDLFHTAGCSYGFLDGHFLDFYDYLEEYGIAENGSVGLGAGYLPTVYVIFAIWNLPMKLFGIVPHATAQLGFIPIMWAKTLPCLVLFLSAAVLFQILGELGFSDNRKKMCVYAFITAPAVLFGQFALGQYESFLVFFILLGFYFWLKGQMYRFTLCFAVAVTFKYTALIYFLPLLFLKEKSIWKILLHCYISVMLLVIEFLIFSGSPAFKADVFGIGGGTSGGPVGYITNASYFTGFSFGAHMNYVVYLAFLAFALTAAWAYFTKTGNREAENRYAVFFLCLSSAALFCFSKWHPHWLMMAVPFWTAAAFMHRDTRIFMALDILFGVLLIAFSVCQFRTVTDEVMLQNGIFKFMLPGGKISGESAMSDYLGKISMSIELTLITALIAVYAVFMHPKFLTESKEELSQGWLRTRLILPVLVLVIPSILVMRTTMKPSVCPYLEETRAIFVELSEEEPLSQWFTSEGESLKKLKFPVSVGENSTRTRISAAVYDEEGTLLFEREYSGDTLFEGEIITEKPGVAMVPGNRYEVRFTLLEAEKDSTFRLLGAPHAEGFEDALSGNEKTDFHLNLNIYQ